MSWIALPAALVLATTAVAATGPPAVAQAPSCIPSGEGAAPYSGDWTRIPRDERTALCKEGERRREQQRQETRKKSEAAQPNLPSRPEPPEAAPPALAPGPADPCEARSCSTPILRGRDASGVPIITDDPNLLRR